MLQGLYGITICLSAFLMFFVQPLLAKAMLPIFGGEGFVWIACILFFQMGLLLGYSYAYALARLLSYRKQAITHICLLLLSCLSLPMTLHWSSTLETMWPPLAVLVLLSTSIIIPFMVVSSTSPLLQHWYCKIKHTEFPYVFYSVSNFGSLLGLLGYPLLLEPVIGIKLQSLGWSYLYGVYIILCLFCVTRIFFTNTYSDVVAQKINLSASSCLKWLMLTFLSSALLLAVTQFLVQNVMNLPLIWVLPLALYLISYIVVFAKEKSYDRQFWSASFLIWLILSAWLIYFNQLGGFNVVIVLLALLFSACMVCHGELILIKPAKQDLTLFYLFIALGGVLGGIFVNLIAVFIFKNGWDLYLPLIALNIIIIYLCFKQYSLKYGGWNASLCVVSVLSVLVLSFVIIQNLIFQQHNLVAQFRNPYGFIKVLDFNHERGLIHGKVKHGMQFKDKNKSQLPTTYYGPRSGIGLAIEYLKTKQKPLRFGIIGLGAGTLAALGQKEDILDFYDIDKDIKTIALNYFSFIKNSPAKSTIYIGDARLQLQQKMQTNGSQQYDLIVIDAFSGDAIPSHLMTKEAMALYSAHLTKDGIIAFNTSNTYIDFLPVIKALSKYQGCEFYWIENHEDNRAGIDRATWALISCDAKLGLWLHRHEIPPVDTSHIVPYLWTDDLNSILPLLRWENI